MNMAEPKVPLPLLPHNVDLRDYDWMPLDVVRLRDSKTVTKVRAEEFRAAVLLWCASWHQVPAASLPDDEDELAKFAGYGVAVREWRKVREGALRGFVKCTDGRFYHPVVAEKAAASWISKLEQKHRSECARLKKWNQRHKDDPVEVPTFQLWITGAYPDSVRLMSPGHLRNVPRDTPPMSSGHTPNVPDLFAPTEMRGDEIKSLNQHLELQAEEASRVPGDNPTPRPPAGRSTPRAGGTWRRDPSAAQRKLSELGVSPTWSVGKSHQDCIERIEQELAKGRRA